MNLLPIETPKAIEINRAFEIPPNIVPFPKTSRTPYLRRAPVKVEGFDTYLHMYVYISELRCFGSAGLLELKLEPKLQLPAACALEPGSLLGKQRKRLHGPHNFALMFPQKLFHGIVISKSTVPNFIV